MNSVSRQSGGGVEPSIFGMEAQPWGPQPTHTSSFIKEGALIFAHKPLDGSTYMRNPGLTVYQGVDGPIEVRDNDNYSAIIATLPQLNYISTQHKHDIGFTSIDEFQQKWSWGPVGIMRGSGAEQAGASRGADCHVMSLSAAKSASITNIWGAVTAGERVGIEIGYELVSKCYDMTGYVEKYETPKWCIQFRGISYHDYLKKITPIEGPTIEEYKRSLPSGPKGPLGVIPYAVLVGDVIHYSQYIPIGIVEQSTVYSFGSELAFRDVTCNKSTIKVLFNSNVG